MLFMSSLAPQLRDLNKSLVGTGWTLLEVTTNTSTGFARVIAERRDAHGQGMKVTLHRSVHGEPELEMRDVIERRPGMYRDHWEVVSNAHMGRRRFDGFRSALRGLANYIDDNKATAIGSSREALRQLAVTFPPL